MSETIKETIPSSGYSVITINREYAAKGRSLAAALSDRLGIPYYDKDFVIKTAEESGYEHDLVLEESEEISVTGDLVDRLLRSTVSYKSSYDEIFKAEVGVILKLAKSPCIIVGRCADDVLRKSGISTLSVFLNGSVESRMKHAEELAENGNTPLGKYIDERDKKRRLYYKKYTGREIDTASNYTICLNTGEIDIPVCADIVERLYRDSHKEA